MPGIKEFMDVKDVIVLMMGGREAPSCNYTHVQEYFHSIFIYMYLYAHICIHAYLHTYTLNDHQVECRIAIYYIILRIFLSVLDIVGCCFGEKFCLFLCRNFYLDSEISQYSYKCPEPLHSISC